MAEFHKKNEKKRKAEKEWVNQFNENYKLTLRNIERHQDKKILTSQVILLTILGAFFVNLLTSSLYSLIINANFQQLTFVISRDVLITLCSSFFLVVIFFWIRQQLSDYAPPQPVLTLFVKPEDTEGFLYKNQFNVMMKYIEDGNFLDFRGFGKYFFEDLEKLFSHLFHPEVNKKPIREDEILEEPASKLFPTLLREYDLSAMSKTGVFINLEVVLVPQIVYTEKTAPYSFYIVFRFKILNPDHCHADDFLQVFFYLKASHIVAISSYSINRAFSKIIPNFWDTIKKLARSQG